MKTRAIYAVALMFASAAIAHAAAVRTVALSGQPAHAPGTPSGAEFGGFHSALQLNATGQVAFMAGVNDGKGGIWATDRNGHLRLITRVGDVLEVAPGDFRTISEISFVHMGSGNSDGRPSGFNNLGQIAFWASFEGGSQGLFVSNRVAVPEPPNLVLLAACVPFLAWRRLHRRAKTVVSAQFRLKNRLLARSYLAITAQRPMVKHTLVRPASLVYVTVFVAAVPITRADIFQWEYINPDELSQGKQQSATLCPEGAGVTVVPGVNLSNRNLTMAYLAGAELYPGLLCDSEGFCSDGSASDLSNTNLSQAYLRGANLNLATLTGANLTGADIRGASFGRDSDYYPGSGISLSQLYSTSSYQSHDLTGVVLVGNDLTGANLTGQNLTSTHFSDAALQGANLAGADIRWASFARYSRPPNVITVAQLQSTASYLAHDLTGVNLRGNNLNGANFTGQNLSWANFEYVDLTGANLSQANFTNASFASASLNDANFTGTQIHGATLRESGVTLSQLYATASYQTHDLSQINFQSINLAGANFAAQNLSGSDFRLATLTGANLSQANLANSYLRSTELTNVDLSQAILTNADLRNNPLTGISLSNANIQGADFSYSGITLAQLYSTASYKAQHLRGTQFGVVNLAGANLATQDLTNVNLWAANLDGADLRHSNLTNAFLFGTTLDNANLTRANFTNADISAASFINANLRQANLRNAKVDCPDGCSYVNLSGANLTEAEIRGASLGSSGITSAQLISTASYKTRSLSGTQLYGNDFAGIDLASQDLTNSSFALSNLTGANLSGADARGANFENATLASASTGNFIQTNGHVAGLDLTAGKSLFVRDYDGNPAATPPSGPLPIVIEQHVTMDASGVLRLEFDADAWDSRISFAPRIPLELAGTLELGFAPGVDPASQIGRTLDVFDWSLVSPTGQFQVTLATAWDLSQLYTSGQIRLIGLPGDMDSDLLLTAADIDALAAAVRTGNADARFDLTGDGNINLDDHTYWVNNVKHTSHGDANLDGHFDSTDMVVVFQAGEYEDSIGFNSLWSTGDWNGDGDFTSSDLVSALADGRYEQARPAAAVPEPACGLLLVVGCALWGGVRPRRRR